VPRPPRTFRHVLYATSAVVLLIGLTAGVTLSILQTAPADVFARDTQYGATTYEDHGNYFLRAVAPCRSVDIAMPEGTPLHAPRDGIVRQVEWGYGLGWGVSIIWTSENGREQLHLGHLSRVVATGPVRAGEIIALVGHTGHCFPKGFSHLHIDRTVDGRVVPVVLSGVTVKPGPDPEHPRWYVSRGPAQREPAVRAQAAHTGQRDLGRGLGGARL
jgi:murein DD-endopeptidase MepM/ murein hydrolase activator NlpD